jgi:hypothetical protein
MIKRFPFLALMFIPTVTTVLSVALTYRVAYLVARESGNPDQVGWVAAGALYVTGGLYVQVLALKLVEHVTRRQLDLEERRLEILREQRDQKPPETWRTLSQDTPAAFDPGVVYVPGRPGEWIGLHINIEQLRFIQARIKSGKPNVPFDLYGSGKPFTRPALIAFREELLERALATHTRGQQVVIKPDGCVSILRGSPTPLVQRQNL